MGAAVENLRGGFQTNAQGSFERLSGTVGTSQVAANRTGWYSDLDTAGAEYLAFVVGGREVFRVAADGTITGTLDTYTRAELDALLLLKQDADTRLDELVATGDGVVQIAGGTLAAGTLELVQTGLNDSVVDIDDGQPVIDVDVTPPQWVEDP